MKLPTLGRAESFHLLLTLAYHISLFWHTGLRALAFSHFCFIVFVLIFLGTKTKKQTSEASRRLGIEAYEHKAQLIKFSRKISSWPYNCVDKAKKQHDCNIAFYPTMFTCACMLAYSWSKHIWLQIFAIHGTLECLWFLTCWVEEFLQCALLALLGWLAKVS